MKLTIESTTKIVEVNGVPARVWEGVTENGVRIHCFITRIGVASDDDQSQFERELKHERAPSPEVQAIPYRLLL